MPPRKTKAASEGIAPVVKVKSEPAPKPAGYVFGRPTAYDPSFCELAISLGKQGKSKTYIAGTIGVVRQTIENWAVEYPDFLDALRLAKIFEQMYWEDEGQVGMKGTGFNSAIWAKNMSCRFRDEWSDRQEISGPGGSAIQLQDMSSVSEEQLRNLAAAGLSGISASGTGAPSSD